MGDATNIDRLNILPAGRQTDHLDELYASEIMFRAMRELAELTTELGMHVLVEVHDARELERTLPLNAELLGINNRDLRTFETSLDTTIALLPDIPAGATLVTESAIHTADDIALMRGHGVNHFLVGEAFMRADDPGARLKELFELS